MEPYLTNLKYIQIGWLKIVLNTMSKRLHYLKLPRAGRLREVFKQVC